MPHLSAITACKGRLEHLKQTLPRLLEMAACEVIVVDYDCPDGSANWVRTNHPGVSVIEVKERATFNLSEARNLGAAAATAPWLLFIDADLRVAPGTLWPVVRNLEPGAFWRIEPFGGTTIVSRADYDALGGFDEAFEGWGSEDIDFFERLILSGSKPRPFPAGCFTELAHNDTARTQFHEIGDKEANHRINIVYRMAKFDLMRNGAALDLSTRKAIYAEIKTQLATGQSVTINLPFKKSIVYGRAVTTSLRYDVDAILP